MNILIFITFFVEVLAFRSLFREYRGSRFQLYCKKGNDLPKIINIDFNKLIDEYDKLELEKIDNIVPQPPKSVDEIEEDSFEGYLLTHFNVIKNSENLISFERFLSWRKQVGTLLTTDEVFNIYNEINNKKDLCDIMNFILINKVIDEVDGADF